MPAKMSRSAPRPPFRLREVSIAVRTLRLSCRKAGKAPIFTPVRESSGESRLSWLGPGLHWQPPGAQPERKKSRRSQQRERLWHASLRAEDAAVAYLHKFDPAVAFATACSVERTLGIKWEAEQEEMRRRRDPRKVMEISSTRVRELNVALARLPQGVRPDPAAERYLLQIFKGLPPDRAWWIARTVVRYQNGQFQADCEQRADVPTSELESPEAHAAPRLGRRDPIRSEP